MSGQLLQLRLSEQRLLRFVKRCRQVGASPAWPRRVGEDGPGLLGLSDASPGIFGDSLETFCESPRTFCDLRKPF